MKTSTLYGTLLLLAATTTGCLIDDSGSPRGRTDAPAASVPDTGGPTRRESASKTLDDAEREQPGSSDLKVEPAPPAQ